MSATAEKTQEKVEESKLPAPVARRGIDEATWRTLKSSIYPGALSDSILMAWDYCAARGLDPLKKPVHIVPMQVTEKVRREDGSVQERKVWRDVIMPGIAELRTTAVRTGQYLGHSDPEYGPDIEYKGVTAPEWCRIVVKRLVGSHIAEFPFRELFREAVATKNDGTVNAMWSRRPVGQLTKCTLAGALRDAFPEELGNTLAAEEMEGRTIDLEQSDFRREPEGQDKGATLQAKLEQKRKTDIEQGLSQPVSQAENVGARVQNQEQTEHDDFLGALGENYGNEGADGIFGG